MLNVSEWNPGFISRGAGYHGGDSYIGWAGGPVMATFQHCHTQIPWFTVTRRDHLVLQSFSSLIPLIPLALHVPPLGVVFILDLPPWPGPKEESCDVVSLVSQQQHLPIRDAKMEMTLWPVYRSFHRAWCPLTYSSPFLLYGQSPRRPTLAHLLCHFLFSVDEKLTNLLVVRGGLGKVVGEAVGCCQKQRVTTEQDEAARDHVRLKNTAPVLEEGQLKGSWYNRNGKIGWI